MDGEPCYSLEIGYTQLKHKARNKYYAKFPTNLYQYSLLGRKKNDVKMPNNIGGNGKAMVSSRYI